MANYSAKARVPTCRKLALGDQNVPGNHGMVGMNSQTRNIVNNSVKSCHREATFINGMLFLQPELGCAWLHGL